MGQYHVITNLDKRERLGPWSLGAKASEQAANQVGPLAMFYLMVCPEARGGGDFFVEGPYMGRWHGDRVVVLGDYAEDGDFDTGGPVAASELWDVVLGDTFTDIAEAVLEALRAEDAELLPEWARGRQDPCIRDQGGLNS
jgi:hypothetical protein